MSEIPRVSVSLIVLIPAGSLMIVAVVVVIFCICKKCRKTDQVHTVQIREDEKTCVVMSLHPSFNEKDTNIAVSQMEISRNCQSLGANLASVRNKPENGFLLSLLPSPSTHAWIGANDAVQDGHWLWSDGSVFLFTHWCSGEPNNYQQHPENCLEINHISNRCWNDASCSNSLPYICGKDLYDCDSAPRIL
ncbi:brevican core protein [Pimephales promelas]|nr:brevican core protein [Pimephales promelas]